MAKLQQVRESLLSGQYDAALKDLYLFEDELSLQKKRYSDVIDDFAEIFDGERNIGLYSAPGRSEVGGNHTDHNHGKVLAAGINLDAIAAVSKNDEGIVRVKSAGYDMDVVDLSDLEIHKNEFGRSCALVRGTCARFKELGYNIGGFDAATASRVLSGSGLSSSAAFEVLVGTIMNYLYNDGKISPVEIAKIAQYAENVYFNKPCGLLDQMACSVGSFVNIDFANPEAPVINKVGFDFASCNHALCIVDTGGSHSDLTDEYAAVRSEMEAVAEFMGKKVLRDVDENAFIEKIPEIREKLGERAVLRAMHFYADNARVDKEVAALNSGDFDAFKKLIIESGHSSYMYNQNVYACKKPLSQPVSLALALSEKMLKGKGAWRVHGGGFAGTIQAFVPTDMLEEYKSFMEKVFGEGSCYVLAIRPVGGAELIAE